MDYGLRLTDGDIKTGGVHIIIASIFVIIVGVIAVFLQYKFLTETNLNIVIQFVLLAAQVGIGFVIFAAAGLFYTVGFGIDSL